MVTEFDVFMGETVVGTVAIERQGLYYYFDCRCRLPAGSMCRVIAEQGDHRENLGVLAPSGGVYCLITKLPAKRFKDGKFTFQVLPKHQSAGGFFAPVYPDEPFKYISRLQNAFLEERNGQIGVVIPDLEPAQPGSGQNP